MVGGGQWVEKLLKDRPPLMEVVQEMLHHEEHVCKTNWPDVGPKDWRPLYELDYQREIESLTQWFDHLLTAIPFPPDINGIYFVLWPQLIGSPESTVAVLLSGSREQSDSHDWRRDNHWMHDEGVFISPLLTSIYAQFVPPEKLWRRDRERALYICWQFLGLVVTGWICGPMRKKILGNAPRRHIEVGFDYLIRFNLGDLTPENTPSEGRASALGPAK